MSFPAAVGRIMGLLRNGSEGVATEAAGLVAALIGGGPGDANVMDSKGECTQQLCIQIAVIMRSIAEEDAIAVESVREASVHDGALLRHLLHAFFLPAGERREVSRQLVALWADSYQPALELLP
ncbi:hypothetical protein HN51_002484 [Arachis hypogaea]